jgi:hypothetical protein
VFGNHVSLNWFLYYFRCGWSWPPSSLDSNPWNYFLWDYLNDCVYCTNLHTVRLQAETEAAAEEITVCMT